MEGHFVQEHAGDGIPIPIQGIPNYFTDQHLVGVTAPRNVVMNQQKGGREAGWGNNWYEHCNNECKVPKLRHDHNILRSVSLTTVMAFVHL